MISLQLGTNKPQNTDKRDPKKEDKVPMGLLKPGEYVTCRA